MTAVDGKSTDNVTGWKEWGGRVSQTIVSSWTCLPLSAGINAPDIVQAVAVLAVPHGKLSSTLPVLQAESLSMLIAQIDGCCLEHITMIATERGIPDPGLCVVHGGCINIIKSMIISWTGTSNLSQIPNVATSVAFPAVSSTSPKPPPPVKVGI